MGNIQLLDRSVDRSIRLIWCVPCLRWDQPALQAHALLAHLSALDFLTRGGFLLAMPLANHKFAHRS
jgi:hypothetical protein